MKIVQEQGDSISGINITPIIDITLVLLIVMLVAAPVLNIPNLPVNLPEAFTAETKEQNVSVSLGSDLRIGLDDEVVKDPKNFPRRLKMKLKTMKKAVIIVRADKDIAYVEVENLMALIRQVAPQHRIAVATRQKNPGEQHARP